MAQNIGKLKDSDKMIDRGWKWLPWLAFFLASVPVPLVFLLFVFTASAPDQVAFYLALSVLSLGVGVVIGLLILLLLFLGRRRWLRKLRDRLAEDGITANEINWFSAELTSAERHALRDIKKQNPVLADAYAETLASRLTATRIINRARSEQMKVERRINRARSLVGADTSSLLADLQADHREIMALRTEASSRLAETKARLQMIEAAASRSLNQKDTDLMLRRLTESQNYLPLSIEMVRLERQALKEAQLEIADNDLGQQT